tara:strand:+ start:758 stop:1021 length:264 start_codon:yes stop_codon:yes gene_type:complete
MKKLEPNYAIVAIRKDNINADSIDIIHTVLQEGPPTWSDFLNLYKELQTDEEFGLIEEDFVLLPGSDDMIRHFKQEYETLVEADSKS